MNNEEYISAKGKTKSVVWRLLCATFSILYSSFFILHSSFFISGCARMGSPDGGWYDDTPPFVVGSTPSDKGTNIKAQKIAISINEFIKIEDAQNKVIVSPPQLEMPEIRAAGRRILVELKDTLKENTTYTVDFSDAISDNNEGNPMGNYTFSFSTGDHIDTLEVSGYVLNAENLEPVKGILVGLYEAGENVSDSLLRSTPMIRVSRTNGSGFFVIKGVAPGQYVAYALQDADGDYLFSQKSEMVAFNNDILIPTCKPDTRPDTIWRDSLHIENIKRIGYTHFLPDDVTLLAFQEPQTDRYLLKSERPEPNKLALYFTYGSDSLPNMKGLNFEGEAPSSPVGCDSAATNITSPFIVEPSLKNDTIIYWLNDTTLINQDTLRVELSFLATDTLGQLALNVDTVEFLPKQSYEKRMKERQKEMEKWQKEQNKKKKKGEPYDSIFDKPQPLQPKINPASYVEPGQTITIEMPQPLQYCDTSAIHLYEQIDSTWCEMPFTFRQRSVRVFEAKADWKTGTEYKLEMDSAMFTGIYGNVSDRIKQALKVKKEEEYSSLVVEVEGLPQLSDTARLIVQLLDNGDKPLRQAVAGKNNTAEFLYLKPGKYYLRAFIDENGNGLWDTGCYDEGRQAEAVFYHKDGVECKEKWDVTRRWNLTATPRYKQKPDAITKQKPDQQRKQKNRNLERAKKLGKQYVR